MYKFTAFSFGAGVQSTALLLLILKEPQRLIDAVGSIPSKLYFADTRGEPVAIYSHLAKIQELFLHHRRAGKPVPRLQIVKNGRGLLEESLDFRRTKRTFIPLFVLDGILTRKCTKDFKINPIQRAIRKDLGYQKGDRISPNSVALWLGISIDEASRMRISSDKWIENIYPLVELGWDRSKCYEYCLSHGIEPKKSRCFFCPFIRDWNDIKRNQPEEFAKAIDFDKQIRDLSAAGVRLPAYLHKSCKPLDEAIENQGHLWEGYADEFENECVGMCGV